MNRPADHGFVSLRALAVALGWVASYQAATLLQAEEIDFSREVLPILSENCLHCHGPDAGERKADLRLDTFEGATQDFGDGSAAVKPGDAGKSLLVERVASPDPDEIMPPSDSGKTLTSGQKETLKRWIEEGAIYKAHWAFQPIALADPPTVSQTNDHYTAIDRFIVEALEKQELSLSEPAGKRQLIRRATFDLTGLPPTWSEVEAFVKDKSPEAFEKVLDRLLESPTYGERWGRHWLDLARYADTHGGSAIGFKRFPFSYTYRDYVIGAFNADLPYDRFIMEQLAADQLNLAENDPSLAALGFLTIGRQYRNVHDRLDDQIDVISRGLLGLTVSCARCHDHKFDPIPTSDYYSLHAALSSSRVPNELPLVGKPTILESYQIALEARKRHRSDAVREQGDVMRGRLRMQVGAYLAELAKGVPEQDTSTFFLSYRTEDLRPKVLESWRKYLAARDENDPVFGPWHQLAAFDESEFEAKCQELVSRLIEENGDPKAFANEHLLNTKAPKWNPRVLEALEKNRPSNFVAVAETYGEVFAEVHRRWLTSLLEASIEASPGGELVSDQDAKHRTVNSAIERQLRHHLYDADSPTSLSFEKPENLTMLNRGVRDRVSGTLGAIHNLDLTSTAPPRSMVLKETADESKKSFVFLRGNPVQRGEPVQPGFLSVITTEKNRSFRPGQQRADLARAIVDPENPLTRRVVVNWVWQHHFGRGLVSTADDFGTRGDPPSHPELLDFLATQFKEDGWSLKKLHRRIMLSAVYRQASTEKADARKADPHNALLWRMPTRKLKMESMRDSLLAASGELELTPGGRPFEEKTDQNVVPRRSVYAFLNRDVISPMAATFDGADPSACTVKRQETMVPQQTLFALNSEFIRGRAEALMAQPEIAAAVSDEACLKLIYQRAYARHPEADELALALGFLGEPEGRNPDAWPQFVHALLAANEFHFID